MVSLRQSYTTPLEIAERFSMQNFSFILSKKYSGTLFQVEISLLKKQYGATSVAQQVDSWGIINELTSRKLNNLHISEIKQNGISISNSQDLSETFNDHFATIGPKLAKEIPLNVNDRFHLDYLKGLPSDNQVFQLIPTNSSKIHSLLSRLNKSKATGLDKISARLLRECADLIASSLCLIFNCSISTGIFPGEWTCSKVIPLFKQGGALI